MRALSILCLALAASTGAAAEAPPRPTAEDFTWLAGCWASEGREPGSGEMWTAPAGGTLLGVQRTVRNGRTVASEFLQIRENDDGTIDYVALPSDQQLTAFRLVSMTTDQVTFEKPDHDFPQRVIYRRPEEGVLVGRIEGTLDGRERSVDFPMRRVACETLAE